MRLRRKLVVTFGALTFLALLIVALSFWANARYASAGEELHRHYARSLVVQGVRAAVFRASEELPDAVFQREQDFRADWARQIGPARSDLREWAALADTDGERAQAERVRRAFAAVVRDAERVFAAVEEGRLAAARRLYEGGLDQERLDVFELATDQAVASDRQRRRTVRASVADTLRATQLVLLIAAFGAVSVTLLIGAYLAADVFRPLARLRTALDGVARGDRATRLDDGRADELGEVHRSFDAMVGALAEREAVLGVGLNGGNGNGGGAGAGAHGPVPSRVALHRVVAQLRGRVAALGERPEDRAAAVRDLDGLLRSLGTLTDLGFPLDLELARVDLRALLHDVVDRSRDELVRRGVRLELAPSPDLDVVLADRRKLREVLHELVRNALDALPERGGSLGLRTDRSPDGAYAVIDVADDAGGLDVAEHLLAGDGPAADGAGLPSSRAIVEQHGGRLLVDTRPGQGTLVRVLLPLAE